KPAGRRSRFTPRRGCGRAAEGLPERTAPLPGRTLSPLITRAYRRRNDIGRWQAMNTGPWDTHAPDALAHLQTTVTALHQSIEPAAIRSNVLEVFSAVNHLLYGGEWWYDLGTEYQAWEQIDPHGGQPEWFTAARDAIAGSAYELCAHAAVWLSGSMYDWGPERDEAVGQLVWVSASVRGG